MSRRIYEHYLLNSISHNLKIELYLSTPQDMDNLISKAEHIGAN